MTEMNVKTTQNLNETERPGTTKDSGEEENV